MAARNGKLPPDADDIKAVTARLRARGIWGFWKVGRDAAGPGAEIMYPGRTKRFDYEGELAIVLGKPAKDFKADGRSHAVRVGRDALRAIGAFAIRARAT